MNLKNLDRGELIATVGGVILGISLFLHWYSLDNRYAQILTCHGPPGGTGTCTGWQALQFLRFLLLIAAVAPAILVYIILRGHALTWPRGELTALVALLALTFIVFRGLIDKPGAPPGEIGISYGWFVALLGGLLILAGSVLRSQESAGRRKPPGVL